MARLGAAAYQVPGARKHSKQQIQLLRIAAPLLAVLPMLLLAAYYGYGRVHAGAGFATRSGSSSSSSSSTGSRSSSALADSSNSTASPFLAHMLTPQGCPAWISKYAAFHRQQRGRADAKYLVYSACPGSSGLGDRVRGMMYLTRQAVATNRVILFTWRDEPHELQRYLPPAGPIDWTLDGIKGYNYPDLGKFCGKAPQTEVAAALMKLHDPTGPNSSSSNSGDREREEAPLIGKDSITFRAVDYLKSDRIIRNYTTSQGLLHKLDQYRFVTIHTNEWQSTACKGCPAIADPAPAPTWDEDGSRAVNNSAACLYRHLFGISADVQAAAQQQLEKLYGSQAKRAGFQYLAVHMRLGGMEQEKWLRSSKVSRNGPLVDLVHGITCIKKLGHQMGIESSRVPVLLFTDHLELRKFIKQGGLSDVITSDVTPTHLARMRDDEAADPQSAMSTYVDLVLMARARCAVYSRSGYSMTAWMMGGGTDCYELYQRGLDRCLNL